jgi:hypothetical protein
MSCKNGGKFLGMAVRLTVIGKRVNGISPLLAPVLAPMERGLRGCFLISRRIKLVLFFCV